MSARAPCMRYPRRETRSDTPQMPAICGAVRLIEPSHPHAWAEVYCVLRPYSTSDAAAHLWEHDGTPLARGDKAREIMCCGEAPTHTHSARRSDSTTPRSVTRTHHSPRSRYGHSAEASRAARVVGKLCGREHAVEHAPTTARENHDEPVDWRIAPLASASEACLLHVRRRLAPPRARKGARHGLCSSACLGAEIRASHP